MAMFLAGLRRPTHDIMAMFMWRLPWLILLHLQLTLTSTANNINVHFIANNNNATICTNDRIALNISSPWSTVAQHCITNANANANANTNTIAIQPRVGLHPIHSQQAPLAQFPLCTDHALQLLQRQQSLNTPPRPRQVIWCAVDQELCQKPTAVEAIGKGLFGGPNEDPATSQLSITFDQSTNMPHVIGNRGVDSVLTFSQKIGSN